ncbi:MAG: SMC-Scp complex subunit ScpB, partial [Planctomycetes bacterium]|nr:SMC-Scp complex subunit ScpB [Planctomycetota bacterium]
TTKRLRRLLGGSVDHDLVTESIDRLNRQYAEENRPYEIRLELGGYRMALRPEFEKVRHRVYGLGPKEVRLSHDALEVLALVAYFQPITRRELERKGRPNAGGVLRQLLRRELICIKRDPDQPKEVKYCTTPRFLSLFGLGDIDELPQPEDFEFK